MIKVYHLDLQNMSDQLHREVAFRDVPDVAVKLWADGHFVRVAEVDTNELDVAFARTNHIDQSWMQNDGVRVLSDPINLKPGVVKSSSTNHRSTSVGDVMQDDNGAYYLVSAFGFTPIEVDH